MLQLLADHLVERVDVGRAGGDVGEARIGLHDMRLADGLEEAAPLAIVVGEHSNPSVPGLIWPTMRRECARVAGGTGGRIEGAALHMLGQHELRHGLEHRDLDPLADPGACACQQSGEQCIGRGRTDDAIDRRHRDEARLAGGALQQHRNT